MFLLVLLSVSGRKWSDQELSVLEESDTICQMIKRYLTKTMVDMDYNIWAEAWALEIKELSRSSDEVKKTFHELDYRTMIGALRETEFRPLCIIVYAPEFIEKEGGVAMMWAQQIQYTNFNIIEPVKIIEAIIPEKFIASINPERKGPDYIYVYSLVLYKNGAGESRKFRGLFYLHDNGEKWVNVLNPDIISRHAGQNRDHDDKIDKLLTIPVLQNKANKIKSVENGRVEKEEGLVQLELSKSHLKKYRKLVRNGRRPVR